MINFQFTKTVTKMLCEMEKSTMLCFGGINYYLQRQMQPEIERNRALLERLLDVTLHLAARNLPFRGKTQELGNVHNGNFLATLELLAHYDPLLKDHLGKVKTSPKDCRLIHYLSSDIQNQLIELHGQKVLKVHIHTYTLALFVTPPQISNTLSKMLFSLNMFTKRKIHRSEVVTASVSCPGFFVL